MPRVEVVSKMMVLQVLVLEVENMLVVVNLVVRMDETSLS